MLDQSFSFANFRKIFDIENRKGNYLEGEFLPEVKTLSNEIKSCNSALRTLKLDKSQYTDDELEEKKANLLKKIKALKEKKENKIIGELKEVSAAVNSKGFSISIKEVDIGKLKKVFVAERTAPNFFALKQIQYNIRRLYKVKQANRHQIVCQLRELLGDGFPKYIIKTDVSSFYESIPREHLLKKLAKDPLLTLLSKKLIRTILSGYKEISGNCVGLPRGIGISAYLAEIYMRDIDQTIRNYPGVLFYARYVDDIFVIFCPPPNTGTIAFCRAAIRVFKNHQLKINREKTELLKLESHKTCKTHDIQYIGYQFEIASNSVAVTMPQKKIDRYKQRIDLTFEAYNKESKKSEKKARMTLEKRVRFLTGNSRLINRKKNVVSGIFFSNSLLTKHSALVELDKHLDERIAPLTSDRLKKRLSNHSFVEGFRTRRYHKFSAQELSRIVEVWKHAS